MDHIAIMSKDWGLTLKIASGQKTIESRWYKNRSAPWGKISPGDAIYFKDSGEPIVLKATVSKILQFENLTPNIINGLLRQYGERIGLTDSDLPRYYQRFKDKRYCLLMFLEDVQPVRPFYISKAGYGAMAAWLCIPAIERLILPIGEPYHR
ncbi:MAG TPA: hypothetical protein VGS08_01490 [Candidatus Saccharimonadales bacterium]|nr:hypothetical protein [Candidatus Saccharimonadales bacterium]